MEPNSSCIDKHVKIKQENKSEITHAGNSEQKCSFSKLGQDVAIKEKNKSEIINTDIDLAKNSLFNKFDNNIDIKEEILPEIAYSQIDADLTKQENDIGMVNSDIDSDQNFTCNKFNNHIKEENISNSNKKCSFIKMDNNIVIKQENEPEVANGDANTDIKSNQHYFNKFDSHFEIKEEKVSRTAHIDMDLGQNSFYLGQYESEMTNVDSRQNSSLSQMEYKIKKELCAKIEDENLNETDMDVTPVKLNSKKEETGIVESPSNESKQEGNKGLNADVFRKSYEFTINIAPVNPLQEGIPKDFSLVVKSDVFQCDVCAKPFMTIAAVKRHALIHREPTTKKQTRQMKKRDYHECTFCNRRFSDTQEWELHTARHVAQLNKLQELPCPLCEKTYLKKRTLNDHLEKTHSNALPYTCGNCSQRFQTPKLLLNHERTHVHIACETCGHHFSNRNNLKRHISTVHRCEKLFECELCAKRFTSRAAAQYHMRRLHNPTLKRVRKRRAKTESDSESDTYTDNLE